MVDAGVMRENWSQVRERLQRRWQGLPTEELDCYRSDPDSLADLIHDRTGESRRAVEDFLGHLASESAPAAWRAVEAAKQYAFQTVSAVVTAPARARHAAGRRYAIAQNTVRERPIETLAGVFATGLVAGLVFALMVRSR